MMILRNIFNENGKADDDLILKVWKLLYFSVAQILREIDFGESTAFKTQRIEILDDEN